MLGLLYFLILCFADDSTTDRSASLTAVITNSNLGSDFSINTAKLTTTSSSSKTKTTSIQSAQITEDNSDKGLFKLLFTKQFESFYYDIPVTVDNQNIALRMDLLQNNIWVMNDADFLECEEVDDWWSSEEQIWGSTVNESTLPASVTTKSEFWVTICAESGVYSTDESKSSDVPSGNSYKFRNFEDFRIPYIDAINVTGEVITTHNFSFINSNNQLVEFENFTIVDANYSSVFVGGFGLAGNGLTDTGIFALFGAHNIISSSGYSLYFNNFVNSNLSFAQVIPGVVDKTYFVGDIYSFDMLDHTGQRYESGTGLDFENSLLDYMLIPSTQLDDILMENSQNGATISLKSSTDTYPVIFDSRTIFNLVPLDIIINIAIQTNAFYNNQVKRWIVECDTIRQTEAMVDFKIGDLTIKVPIDDLLTNGTSTSGIPLSFSNGKQACFLNFLPASDSYVTLGLSFLKSVYLAIDNVGGKIGLANSNKELQVKASDYLPNLGEDEDDVTTFNFTQGAPNRNTTDTLLPSSMGYISSGFIPFATYSNYSDPLTLTYSLFNSASDTLTVPARFSGNLITSGELFITQTGAVPGTPESSILPIASPADEGNSDSGGSKLKSFGNGNKSPVLSIEKFEIHWYWIGFVLPLIAFVL